MSNMYGITGIQVKFFTCVSDKCIDKLNEFLAEYDGNIIDIQYQHDSFMRVMVVYKEFEE